MHLKDLTGAPESSARVQAFASVLKNGEPFCQEVATLPRRYVTTPGEERVLLFRLEFEDGVRLTAMRGTAGQKDWRLA